MVTKCDNCGREDIYLSELLQCECGNNFCSIDCLIVGHKKHEMENK